MLSTPNFSFCPLQVSFYPLLRVLLGLSPLSQTPRSDLQLLAPDTAEIPDPEWYNTSIPAGLGPSVLFQGFSPKYCCRVGKCLH